MWDMTDAEGLAAGWYFAALIVIGSFLLLNAFIAGISSVFLGLHSHNKVRSMASPCVPCWDLGTCTLRRHRHRRLPAAGYPHPRHLCHVSRPAQPQQGAPLEQPSLEGVCGHSEQLLPAAGCPHPCSLALHSRSKAPWWAAPCPSLGAVWVQGTCSSCRTQVLVAVTRLRWDGCSSSSWAQMALVDMDWLEQQGLHAGFAHVHALKQHRLHAGARQCSGQPQQQDSLGLAEGAGAARRCWWR